ncbi:DUF2591 family protein [Erwinia aphidicola]|nr:DUF2591 family protein [Erwinia aphidicola]
MDYSKLSDFEIANRVANTLPGRYVFYPDTQYVMDSETEESFDPCNNPADAWPIIVANRITLMPASTGDKWMAQAFDHAIADVSTNPLRSAMIVFLMMQESE